MSIWSVHDGTNRRAPLVTKLSDAHLCDALSSLCTPARGSVVFLGNGFIPLMRLDIYDHMLSIMLIFAEHRRTSITALARNPSLILAWRQLSLCQCMIINVWLIMRPEDVISIFLCSSASLMSTKSSLQSLLTHPLAWFATAREIFDLMGLTACRLKTPYTARRGIPMCLEMTAVELSYPFYWRQ